MNFPEYISDPKRGLLYLFYVPSTGAVVVIGTDEAAKGEVMVKSMRTGEQAAHLVQNTVEAVRQALQQ
jgi:hypothetical protein